MYYIHSLGLVPQLAEQGIEKYFSMFDSCKQESKASLAQPFNSQGAASVDRFSQELPTVSAFNKPTSSFSYINYLEPVAQSVVQRKGLHCEYNKSFNGWSRVSNRS